MDKEQKDLPVMHNKELQSVEYNLSRLSLDVHCFLFNFAVFTKIVYDSENSMWGVHESEWGLQ